MLTLPMIENHNSFLASLHPDRVCGECTACCHVMAVGEIDKTEYTPCEHICEQGCTIYKERPYSCNAWNCGWRNGFINSDRPDKQGLLVDYNHAFPTVPMVLIVREVYPGASREPHNSVLLDELADAWGDVIVSCPIEGDRWHRHGTRAILNGRYLMPSSIIALVQEGYRRFIYNLEKTYRKTRQELKRVKNV